MAPLAGDTLGKKHQNFNKLVNKTISNNYSFDDIKRIESNSDIDMLFKIDLAGHYKNVEYILEMFMSEDMLYVSRAIKRSPWLISDPQYSHIVNPNYLNEDLFPYMMSKAVSKFLLNLRLNLKDEQRVDEFFKYYETSDLHVALKWLPNCSVTVINKAAEKYYDDINDHLFKRLCEKSFDVLDIVIKKSQNIYYSGNRYLKIAMFLITADTERYLDLFEKQVGSRAPKFGAKYTQVIMKRNAKRVIDNFHKYVFSVDVPTFVKYYGKNNIQKFLLNQRKNEKLESWFKYYENIKPYVKAMPKEGKFDFLKKVFIDKVDDDNSESSDKAFDDSCVSYGKALVPACQMLSSTKKCLRFVRKTTSSKAIYQYYRHAPASIAIPELKKLIRIESSPDERIAMMMIMLGAAGSDLKHIYTVLQYFHDRHINEPFRFKIQFLNNVVVTTNTHRYDEACWKILDVLFRSSDVYIESDNNVQTCCEAIILYNLLHNQDIPAIITKKFKFTTYKKKISKLNYEEKEKLFDYLYSRLENKISEQVVTTQEQFYTTVQLVNETLTLLSDWKKELSNYPSLLAKIKELIQIMKQKSWTDTLLLHSLYEKKLRKHLFEESLLLSCTEEVCINALKHDPRLMERYPTQVDTLRFDDKVFLHRLLKKIKIYWNDSLASEWISAYRNRLQQAGGHAAVTRGLFTLLNSDHVMSIIKEYAPTDDKINWTDADELKLSLQKQIAKNMHIARPQPSPNAVLLYAKGDYLQFALPSMNSIFYNISSARSRDYIPKLIDSPVSIQKHVIRLAFDKLKSDEVKQILTEVWKSTKNASIRAVIFELTYRLLRDEKQPSKAEELWQLLEVFIDNLSQEENRSIYKLMEDVIHIPDTIQAKFLMKCYKFLKSLPAKVDCDSSVRILAKYTVNLMDSLDSAFIEDILKEYTEFLFTKNNISTNINKFHVYDVVAMYILCSKTEDCQLQRYETVLNPVLKNCLARWHEKHDNTFVVRQFLIKQLEEVTNQLKTAVITEKKNVVPVKLFKTIHAQLKEALSPEHYVFIKIWEINGLFVESLEEIRPLVDSAPSEAAEGDGPTDDSDAWTKLCHKIMPAFGKQCVHNLKNDCKTTFPSVYIVFSEALKKLLDNLNISEFGKYDLFEALLFDKEFVYSYLIVLQILPSCFQYDDETKRRAQNVRELILTSKSDEVKMHYDLTYFFDF